MSFTCCQCPEPPDYDPAVGDPLPKYLSKCICPSVAVECVSTKKNATLCGFLEFQGPETSPSVPPKRYFKKTTKDDLAMSIVYNGPIKPCQGIITTVKNASGETKVDSYSAEDCVPTGGDWSGDGLAGGTMINFTWSCPSDADPPGCPDYEGGECVILQEGPTTIPIDSLASVRGYKVISTTRKETNKFSFDSGTINQTLSHPDNESAAVARATTDVGTGCTSIDELRTDSFSFTVRTATYTATASNLVVGVQYQGCIRIRRREAYSGTEPEGANTDWEDVEPDTIAAFTATDTEEEVATDVDLPIAKGYEYEVVSAHVWPTSAGCECPTSYP